MAKYNFDELVKKENQGQGLYTKSSEKTEEEAEKVLQQMAFTMNILDGQETEHGGQFDYFIDMKNRTWEKLTGAMDLPERRMVFFLKKRFMSSQPVWPLYLRCRRSSL